MFSSLKAWLKRDRIQEVLDAPDKEFMFIFMVSGEHVLIQATSADVALTKLMTMDFSVYARANAFLIGVDPLA